METGQRTLMKIGTLIIGLLTIGAGFLYGRSSYTTTFQSLGPAGIANIIYGDSSNGNVSYLSLQNQPGNAIYILNVSDFSPSLQVKSIGSQGLTIVYRDDMLQNVDVSAADGFSFKGNGHTIVAFTDLASSQMYTTSIYRDYPNGYYNDRWTLGEIFMGIGGFIALISLFIGEYILILVGTTLGGMVAAPLAFFYFVGYFANNTTDVPTATNIPVAIVTGAIGALIGFGAGIGFAISAFREDRAEKAKQKAPTGAATK